MPHLLTLPKEVRDVILIYSIECSFAQLERLFRRNHQISQLRHANDPRAWVFSYGDPYCRRSSSSWPDCKHVPTDQRCLGGTQPALLTVNHQLRNEFLPLLASSLTLQIRTDDYRQVPTDNYRPELSNRQLLPENYTAHVKTLQLSRDPDFGHYWLLQELGHLSKLEKIVINHHRIDDWDVALLNVTNEDHSWTGKDVFQPDVLSAMEARMRKAFEDEARNLKRLRDRTFVLEVEGWCGSFWVEEHGAGGDSRRSAMGDTLVSSTTVLLVQLLT